MANGRQRTSSGYAYLLLLMAVALIGIAAASALQLGATMARRDAEQQLLAIGAEYELALRSYAGLPAGMAAASGGRGPRTLDELVRDPRVPGLRRHLRQIYADPLTGRQEWGLVRDGEGFITGVFSLSDGKPVAHLKWPSSDHGVPESYRDWVFGIR